MTVEHFLSIIGFSAACLAITALIGLAYLSFKATSDEKTNLNLMTRTFTITLILGNCFIIASKFDTVKFLLYTTF